MDNTKCDRPRKQPVMAPAPIQGNGPAWEGQPLRREDATAVVECEGPADSQQQHTIEEGGPSGHQGSTDAKGSGSLLATSSPPGAVSPSVKTSTGVVKPGELAEGGDSTTCGGVGHAQHARDTHLTINSGLITPKEKSPLCAGRDSDVDHFQELLEVAIRQSDMERAQDRESARNFQRLQQTSTPERPHSTEDQHSSSTPGAAVTTHRGVSHSGKDDDNVESIDSGLQSPAAPSPTLERQWVRYLSPEGYAYMYDEVTGDSEWVVPGEEEDHSSDANEGAAYGQPGISLNEQDVQVNLQDTAAIKTRGRGTKGHAAEGESVGTCEVSQWPQDTSGPDARNAAGETAMHLAATQRSLRGITLLLANGASINATDDKGRTPLHAACASSHCKGSSSGDSDTALVECVELLLSSGALEDARDVNGQTPLHLSALAGNLGAAKALLVAGATATADNTGNSPLHLAAARGHPDVIQLLVAGNLDEPSQNPLPPASLSLDIGEQGRAHAAVVGEPHSAFDANLFLSAHERGPAAIVSGRSESEVAVADDRGTFEDNSRAARRYGTSNNRPKSTRKSTERVDTEDSNPGYGGGGGHGDNHLSWGGNPPRRPAPLDQEGVYGGVERRWQGQGNGDDNNRFYENPTQNAAYAACIGVAGKDGDNTQAHVMAVDPTPHQHHHRLRSEGKGGRRYSSGRRGGRYSDHDDQAFCWPEPLPEHEYEQVLSAAFAKQGTGDALQVATSYSDLALSAALFAACLASHPHDATAVLRLLEVRGVEVAAVRDENGRTPLHHVCRAGDVGLVRLLCQAGADAAARDCQGNSPLTVAAATGSLACLQLLIQGGNDLNCSNDAGDTPLHVSVRHGNLSCVKTLVESGATLSQRNTLGFTPREDLLNAKPMFTRGRLPKALRATLEYIEYAEVCCHTKASAAQPNSPTWTAQDDWYGSEATAVTAASRQSPPATGNDRRRLDSYSCAYSLAQTSSSRRRQLGLRHQQYLTKEALPGHRPRMGDTAGMDAVMKMNTERREREQEWEPRKLEGVDDFGDAQRFDKQSEDGVSSGGSRRGRWNRRGLGSRGGHVAPAATSTVGEASDEDQGWEKEPAAGCAGPPSSTRKAKGLWSAVGRAIDSLIGTIGTGGIGPYHHSESGLVNSPPSDEQDRFAHDHEHRRQRPPTDAELRASMVRSSSSESGSQSQQQHTEVESSPEIGAPSASGITTAKVPISLTPMQPPPDVLAAMKGRRREGAAVGRRRPRFSAPPADVVAALEKTRTISRNHGGTSHGGDEHEHERCSAKNRCGQGVQPQQESDLGPFSLSETGELGKQGVRSERSMYQLRLQETGVGVV